MSLFMVFGGLACRLEEDVLSLPTVVSLSKKVVPFLTPHTSTGLTACPKNLT